MKRRTALALYAAAMQVCTLSGLAVDSSWTQLSSGSWSAAGNWNAGVPVNLGDRAFFPVLPGNVQGVELDLPVTLSGLTFQTGVQFTLNGVGTNSLTLQGLGGNASITNYLGTIQRINAPMFFASAVDLNNLYTAGTGPYIGLNGAITGSGTINAIGGGEFQLGGDNNLFSGVVNVNSGTLTAKHVAALGNTAQPTNVNGGTLKLQAVTNDVINLNSGTLWLEAAGTLGGAISVGTTGAISGSTSLTALTRISSAITLSDGTLSLSHGNLQVLGGVAGSGAIKLAGGSVNFATAPIANEGGIIVTGGQHFLDAANTYTGETTISNGILRVNHADALGTTSDGTTIAGPDAFLVINAASAEPVTLNSGNLIYNAIPLTLPTINGGTLTLNAPLAFDNEVSVPSNVTLEINSQGVSTEGLTLNGGTLNLNIGIGVLNSSFKTNGGRVFAVSGTQSIAGGIKLAGGTTTLQAATNAKLLLQAPVAQGGNLYIGAGTSTFLRNGTVEFDSQVANTGSIELASGGSTVFNGAVSNVGSIKITGAGAVFNALVTNAGDIDVLGVASFNGNLAHGGKLNVGAGGTAWMMNSNSYTGPTVISTGGTVLVKDPQGLGDTSAGTRIDGGTLYVDSPTSEPITLNRGSLYLRAQPSVDPVLVSGMVSYGYPVAFGDLEVTSRLSVSIANPNVTFQSLKLRSGTLSFSSVANWNQNIEIAGGVLSSAGVTLGGPIQLTGKNATLGGNFTGTISGNSDVTLSSATVSGTLANDGNVYCQSGAFNGTTAFTGTLITRGDATFNSNAVIPTFVLESGTLTIASGKALTLSGGTAELTTGYVNGAIAGTPALTIKPIAFLAYPQLQNFGAFAGTLDLRAGTFNVSTQSQLGAASGPTILSEPGAMLRLSAGSSHTEPVVLNNGLDSGGLYSKTSGSGGTAVHSGTLTVGTNGGIIGSMDGYLLDQSGPIVGNGTLVTKLARISSNATHSGATVVRDSLYLDGSLQNTGTVQIEKFGSVIISGSGNNRINDNAAIVMQGGIIDASNGANETMGALILDQGCGSFLTSGATLNFAAITRNPGATLTTRLNAGTVIIANNALPTINGIVPPWIVSGSDFVTRVGNRLDRYTATTGDINAAGPTSTLYFSNSAGVTLANSKTINAMSMYGSGSLNLGGKQLTLESGGVILSGTTIANGTLTPGASATDLIVFISGTSTLSASITNFAGQQRGLTVAGGGVYLSGANSFTGDLIASGGSITLMNATTFPGGNSIRAMGGSVNAAFTSATPLNVATLSVAEGSVFSSTLLNVGTFDLQTGTIGARLSGSSPIIKNSPGPLMMREDNSLFSGAVTVNAGTLIAGDGSFKPLRPAGTSTLTINSGGSVFAYSTLPQAVNLNGGTLSGLPLNVQGTLNVNGTAPVLELPNASNVIGTTSIASNTSLDLRVGGTATFGHVLNAGTIEGLQSSGTMVTPSIVGSGTIHVGSYMTVETNKLMQDAVILDGRLTLVQSGTDANVSRVKSLSVRGTISSWQTFLDINDNALVIDYEGTSIAETVRDLIINGSKSNQTGMGIRSFVASSATTSGQKVAVGYAEASDVFGIASGNFRGQATDTTTMLIAYAYQGDANLDRKVNTVDFNCLAGNFGGGNQWYQGDFNYDWLVDSLDFNLFLSNYGKSLPTSGSTLGTVVPEPASLGGIAMMAVIGARRNRKALR